MSENRLELIPEKEAAKLLCREPITLWRWRKSGQISYRKLGGGVFYTADDLNEFLNRSKVAASAAGGSR